MRKFKINLSRKTERLYYLNYMKFKSLQSFIENNKDLGEEELSKQVLSKINDIKNSKDYIKPIPEPIIKLLEHRLI